MANITNSALLQPVPYKAPLGATSQLSKQAQLHGQPLTEVVTKVALAGLSTKTLLTDGKDTYILKQVKNRTIKAVFGVEYLQNFYKNLADRLIKNIPSANALDKDHLAAVLEKHLSPFNNSFALGGKSQNAVEQALSDVVKNVIQELAESTNLQDKVELTNALKEQIFTANFKLATHVTDTQVNFIHTEIMGPKVATALWGQQVVVPETGYLDTFDTFSPAIISKWLPAKLDEFVEGHLQQYIAEQMDQNPHLRDKLVEESLTKKSSISIPPNHEHLTNEEFAKKLTIDNPVFWDKAIIQRPDANVLKLTAEQKEHLGKLYAIALVTGHYDILNNLSCTNSGTMAHLPACVDWGNTFAIGFSGLTKSENAIANQEIPQDDQSVTSMANLFVYEGVVTPNLPRILVKDIFDLGDPHTAQGFSEFIELAYKNQDAVPQALEDALAMAPPSIRPSLISIHQPQEIADITQSRIKQLHRVLTSCKDNLSSFKERLQNDTAQIVTKIFRSSFS